MTRTKADRGLSWRRFLIVCVAVLCSGTALLAQSTTQTVQGLVTDATGAVIPGAEVTLTNVATGVQQVATTNATGNYTFTLVLVGNYEVRCESPGFKTEFATGIRVETGGQPRQDFAMEVGDVT